MFTPGHCFIEALARLDGRVCVVALPVSTAAADRYATAIHSPAVGYSMDPFCSGTAGGRVVVVVARLLEFVLVRLVMRYLREHCRKAPQRRAVRALLLHWEMG